MPSRSPDAAQRRSLALSINNIVNRRSFVTDGAQPLLSPGDIDAILQSCAEAMVSRIPADQVCIWLLDDAETFYRLHASAGLRSDLNGADSGIPADQLRNRLFHTDEPSSQLDLSLTHPIRDPAWAAEYGLIAPTCYPLVARGRIVGFIALFARQPFDGGALSELPTIADAIADFAERYRTDATLREREMLFRRVFEAAADGLFIFDPDTGQIFEGNPAISQMYGYTPAEFIRLNRADLIHPGVTDAAAHFVTQVVTGEAARVKLLHVRRDGSVFPVATQGSMIVYKGRPAILGVVRDITVEEEAQQELERRVAERTQELSLLLDISRDVTSTLDLESLLTLILDQLKTVVDYTGTALLIREDDVLVISGQHGPLSEEDARRYRYPTAGLASVWDRLSRGEAIMIPDVRGTSAEAEIFRALVGAELDGSLAFIRTCLWAPLVVKEELLGILSITRHEPNAFEPRQIEMAMAVARQAAVAIVNARVHEQARTVAVHEERQRLARDLHDAVTQTLFSASLIGDVLPTLWSRNPQLGEEALHDLRILTRGALAEMRTLLFELRPAALEEAPLRDLFQHLADAFTGRSRVSVTVTVEGATTLPPQIQVAFYRIAQEGLNNVDKHAEATAVDLCLVAVPDGTVQLSIRDDGRGFDPNETAAGHFGLQTMRERAAAIDASLFIHSAPAEGTEVLVSWPNPHASTESEEI